MKAKMMILAFLILIGCKNDTIRLTEYGARQLEVAKGYLF